MQRAHAAVQFRLELFWIHIDVHSVSVLCCPKNLDNGDMLLLGCSVGKNHAKVNDVCREYPLVLELVGSDRGSHLGRT